MRNYERGQGIKQISDFCLSRGFGWVFHPLILDDAICEQLVILDNPPTKYCQYEGRGRELSHSNNKNTENLCKYSCLWPKLTKKQKKKTSTIVVALKRVIYKLLQKISILRRKIILSPSLSEIWLWFSLKTFFSLGLFLFRLCLDMLKVIVSK